MKQNHPMSILSVCINITGVGERSCWNFDLLEVTPSYTRVHNPDVLDTMSCRKLSLWNDISQHYFQILHLCVSYQRIQEEVKHTPIKFDKQLMWTCSMTRFPWEFTRPDQKQKRVTKTVMYFANIVLYSTKRNDNVCRYKQIYLC